MRWRHQSWIIGGNLGPIRQHSAGVGDSEASLAVRIQNADDVAFGAFIATENGSLCSVPDDQKRAAFRDDYRHRQAPLS